jgi:polysaccharide biosynthesis transport protein
MDTNAKAEIRGAGRGVGLAEKVWRRRTLFAWVFCAIFGATIIALAVLPVRFLSVGSVIVAEQEPGIESNSSPGWAEKIGDPADLESQLLVIRSPRVLRLAMAIPGALDAVLRECRYKQTSAPIEWVFGRLAASCDKLKPDSEALLDYVQTGYSVGAVGRSRVINISYLSPRPEIAQTLANALINAFLNDQRANMSTGRSVAADWLWQELRQLDRQIRDEDAKIQAFRSEKGLTRGTYAPITSERLTNIGQQLAAAETARANAAARLQEIKDDQTGGTSNAPAALANRAIADLKLQIATTTAELGNVSTTLGPNHPTLRALQHQLTLLQQRVSREVDSIAKSAKNTFTAANVLVVSLRRQMEAAKAEVASATTDEASIENMVRDVEIKRRQYSDLYKRASELETERRVLLGSTRLVSLAELPTKPFFPKPLPFVAAGLVLALLGSVAAVMLRERNDRSVRAAADLSVVPGISTIVGLPELGGGGLEALRRLITSRSAQPALRTALKRGRSDPKLQDVLRKLYAGIMLEEGGRLSRRILITSPAPNGGKTLTTLAFAQFVASTGRRVLAIECEMRRPTFEAVLGVKRSAGLSDVLRGTVEARNAVTSTAIPNLHVIVAGEPALDSTELLMNHHMSELLLWAQSYDLVLLDSPACNALMDPLVIARRVDGVLCCVRWGRSTVADVMESTARLRAAGGNVLGMVITMVNGHDQSRYEGTGSELSLYLKAS